MEMLAKFAFAFYSLIILIGSLTAVLSKSLVRALVGLMGVMIAIAGMYLLLAVPFIAFMQILIYVAGVSVPQDLIDEMDAAPKGRKLDKGV